LHNLETITGSSVIFSLCSYSVSIIFFIIILGRRSRSHGNSFGSGSGYPSDGDEDLQFFDCEEVGDNNSNSGGSGNSSLQGRASNRRNSVSTSAKNANVLSPELLRFYQQDEKGYGMGYKHSHPQLHGEFIEDNLELGQSPTAVKMKNMPAMGAYPPRMGLGEYGLHL